MSTQSLSPSSTLERSGAKARTLSIPMVAVLSVLIPMFGLGYVLFTGYGALTERTYSSTNDTTGELLAHHTVGQSFVARYDGLSSVALRLGTVGQAAQRGIVLHLKRAPNEADIATVSVPATQIKGQDPWQTFAFPAIQNSQDQHFYIDVESPGGKPGRALTLFWWQSNDKGDPYPLGSAFIDGKSWNADLAFSLHYSLSLIGAWVQVARAFSVNAPPLLVIALGVLLLLALVWPIWKIRKGGHTSSPATILTQPWVLPAVLCVGLAHGLLYSLLIPPWQGPDELSHFSYAALLDRYNLDDRVVQRLDWQGKDRDGALIDAIARSMNSHDFTRYVGNSPNPGAPITPDTKSVYAELRQPATYYWLCAVTLKAARHIGLNTDPYTDPDAALRLMRLVSVILSLPIVGLAWLAGRLLAAPQSLRAWLPLLLPLTVTLLPMHAFVDSIANNDVLSELAVSALTVTLIALLRWPRGLRGLLLAALVITLAVVSSRTKPSALAAVVPLAGLGLVAWIGLLVGRTMDDRRWTIARAFHRPSSIVHRPPNRKARVRGVAIGAGIALAIVLATFILAPMLYRPLGTAAGWRLGNLPIEKVPISQTESAHAGKYVLSLVSGVSTSQQLELAVPHPELSLSLTGYARLYTGNGAKTARAVIGLKAANKLNRNKGLTLGASSGWEPFNLTLKIPADVAAATVKLSAQGGTVEFDDFSLASDGISPIAVLLNPSFEKQEVALAKPIAHFLPQEAQWIAEVAANPQTFDRSNLWSYYMNTQFQSFWGNFGWVSLPLSDAWFLFWLVVSMLALLGVLWKIVVSEEEWDWKDWLRVTFLLGSALSILLGFVRQTMLLSVFGIEAYPQGRYLFVLSIPIAWMLLSGLSVWSNLLADRTRPTLARFADKLQATQLAGWLPAWAWINLLVWFAAFALGALVVPYYYG